jgi:LPXTG-site transpeptidase (sortase) family protein
MNTPVFKKASYRRMFIAYAIGIFVVLGSMLFVFHLVPNEFAQTESTPINNVEHSVAADTEQVQDIVVADVIPVRITIASVGINTTVNQPQSQDVELLDQALLKGAVYYPGSGSLVRGNAFVFGHSTGLSVVRNQAFKAFNNLKNVQSGDEIRVTGDDGYVYIYSAISTELVTEDTALVEFDTTDRMLTLSTCNTFGKKEERHVVKAVFVRVEDAF